MKNKYLVLHNGQHETLMVAAFKDSTEELTRTSDTVCVRGTAVAIMLLKNASDINTTCEQ